MINYIVLHVKKIISIRGKILYRDFIYYIHVYYRGGGEFPE